MRLMSSHRLASINHGTDVAECVASVEAACRSFKNIRDRESPFAFHRSPRA